MRKLLAILLCIVIFPAYAINGPQRAVILSGGLNWIINPTNKPDVMLDFANNRSWTKSTGVVSPAASLLTVSRASTGTVNDAAGNWTSVDVNLPRLSNLGLLVEEARTNSIRNNSMAGAVVMADDVELTTNGNFAAQGTGWTSGTSGGGSVVFGTGIVSLTGDGTTNSNYFAQLLTGLTIGRSYVISLAGNTGFNVQVCVGLIAGPGGQGALPLTNISPNGFGNAIGDRVAFTANATSLWVSFTHTAANTVVLTSVSVQDGERVENGGFTSNPINAAQSTVQNGWQWTLNTGTGTVTWNGSNGVTITGDGVNGAQIGTLAISTLVGANYTITADILTNVATLRVGTVAYGTTLFNNATGVGAGQKFQFTATTTTTFISFYKAAAAPTLIQNVSVQSAGALPTNWVDAGGTDTGLVRNVLAVGTTNGINTLDLQWTGTATGTSRRLSFDNSTAISAAYGQTWSHSYFAALVGGALTNVTGVYQLIEENTSGGALVNDVASSDISSGLTSSLQRFSQYRTPVGSTIGALQPRFGLNLTNGAAVNVTFRIGWPQLENNSLVNSTVASAATAASGASGVNGSAVYSVGGGTGTAATLNVTWTAGVMTVNSVASAGSYTVFPPSPAALTYVSGTATGWTGATVNLTPTNNAANAFATSPIVTSGSAATRAADVINMPATFGSAYTMFCTATPQAPTSSPNPQQIMGVNDGTANNMARVFRTFATGVISNDIKVSNVFQAAPGFGGISAPQGTQFTVAMSTIAGAAAGSLNNGVVATSAPLSVPTVNNISFGVHPAGVQQLNGFMTKAAIWQTQAIPNAQLQALQ